MMQFLGWLTCCLISTGMTLPAKERPIKGVILAPWVVVVRDGKYAEWKDLQEGDEVEFTVKDGWLVKIVARSR